MNNPMEWINRRMRLGWLLLGAGLLVGVLGTILPALVSDLPFNARLVTGVGILLAGAGIGYVVRYGAARRQPQVARRLASEERDERMQAIRARAGNRAYWVSTGLAYLGLMWVSFAENGSLPPLSTDALWYFLAGVVILPFIVYAASLVRGQERG